MDNCHPFEVVGRVKWGKIQILVSLFSSLRVKQHYQYWDGMYVFYQNNSLRVNVSYFLAADDYLQVCHTSAKLSWNEPLRCSL